MYVWVCVGVSMHVCASFHALFDLANLSKRLAYKIEKVFAFVALKKLDERFQDLHRVLAFSALSSAIRKGGGDLGPLFVIEVFELQLVEIILRQPVQAPNLLIIPRIVFLSILH